MSEVMISIQPKWCELIVSGKKTVEVRKTKPKLETPFKCYIYCTQGRFEPHEHLRNNLHYDDSTIKVCEGQGKVIGEFVCDDIDKIAVFNDLLYCVKNSQANKLKQMCLTIEEIKAYLGNKNLGFNWHITDLVIYDKPRELCEFTIPCHDDTKCEDCPFWHHDNTPSGTTEFCTVNGNKPLARPPQSWCYVEESKCRMS